MKKLYPKIRDIGLFYSPRTNGTPMALKYIAFLYFGIIIQENGKQHSPQVDATIAIWLYLYRMHEVEKQFRERHRNTNYIRTHNSGYKELTYAANKETSRKYKEYFTKYTNWPSQIQNIVINPQAGRIIKRKEPIKWNTIDFVNPDE